MSYLNQFIKKCHNNLRDNCGHEFDVARKYLDGRNISSKSINFNCIGYCPYDEQIPDEILFYGKNISELDDKSNGFSYFIKGKIIIPIYAEFGRIVGFATRKPSSDAGNTWWNLSKPFYKGHHLFMLDKNRKNIFNSNKIYLVEGYIDAIILNQFGLKGVVGLMGTSLSPRKIGLIARYCNNVCLCLDVDKNMAGQDAQDEAIYSLKKFDFCENISIIEGLPVGEDPDVFVAKNGLDKFLKMEKILSDTEVNRIYKKVIASIKR